MLQSWLIFHLQTQKCLEVISLSDRVLCLHAAWNVLFAGLASGSVASFDLKVSQASCLRCSFHPPVRSDSPPAHSSDPEAAGRVRVPRASRRELPGLSPGGRPPRAAGRLLRQHHQRARRQERPAAAHAGGTHQNRAVHEGELATSSTPPGPASIFT